MKCTSVWDHVEAGIKFKGLLRIQLSVGSEKGSIWSQGFNRVSGSF
jgi:hypothetical protein